MGSVTFFQLKAKKDLHNPLPQSPLNEFTPLPRYSGLIKAASVALRNSLQKILIGPFFRCYGERRSLAINGTSGAIPETVRPKEK